MSEWIEAQICYVNFQNYQNVLQFAQYIWRIGTYAYDTQIFMDALMKTVFLLKGLMIDICDRSFINCITTFS